MLCNVAPWADISIGVPGGGKKKERVSKKAIIFKYHVKINLTEPEPHTVSALIFNPLNQHAKETTEVDRMFKSL